MFVAAPADGREPRVVRQRDHSGPVARLAIAAAADRIASVGAGELLVRVASSGRVVLGAPSGRRPILDLALSADGRRVATTDGLGVAVWDVVSGRRVAALERIGPEAGPVEGVALDAAGRRLFTAGAEALEAWSVDDGAREGRWPTVGPALAMASDGRRLAHVVADGVEILDVEAEEVLARRLGLGAVSALAWSVDGATLVAVADRVWRFEGPGLEPQAPRSLSVAADPIVGRDGSLAWRRGDGVAVRLPAGGRSPVPLGPSADLALGPEDRLWIATASSGLALVDLATGARLGARRGPGALALDAALSDRGDAALVLGADGVVRVWRTVDERPRVLSLSPSSGRYDRVAVDPDGRVAALARVDVGRGFDGIDVIDLLGPEPMGFVPATSVEQLDFLGREPRLVGVSGADLMLWDGWRGEVLGRLPWGHGRRFVLSPDRSALASWAPDAEGGVVSVLSIDGRGRGALRTGPEAPVLALSAGASRVVSIEGARATWRRPEGRLEGEGPAEGALVAAVPAEALAVVGDVEGRVRVLRPGADVALAGRHGAPIAWLRAPASARHWTAVGRDGAVSRWDPLSGLVGTLAFDGDRWAYVGRDGAWAASPGGEALLHLVVDGRPRPLWSLGAPVGRPFEPGAAPLRPEGVDPPPPVPAEPPVAIVVQSPRPASERLRVAAAAAGVGLVDAAAAAPGGPLWAWIELSAWADLDALEARLAASPGRYAVLLVEGPDRLGPEAAIALARAAGAAVLLDARPDDAPRASLALAAVQALPALSGRPGPAAARAWLAAAAEAHARRTDVRGDRARRAFGAWLGAVW